MKYLIIIITMFCSTVAFPQATVRVQTRPLFGGPHFGRVYWNMSGSSYTPRTSRVKSPPLRINTTPELNLTPNKLTVEVDSMVQATLRKIKPFKNKSKWTD